GGRLYKLELMNGNHFNNIQWNGNMADNTVIVTQRIVGPTVMEAAGYGVDITCDTFDLVKEGNFNDENGDGFAQEGETITYTFELANANGMDIENPEITDPMFDDEITNLISGDDNSDGILNPGEVWIY